jgi:hypothetical protein
VALVGFLLVWFFVCRRKKDTDSSSGEDWEAEDGAAAAGDQQQKKKQAPVASDICIGTSTEQESTFYVDTALTTPDSNKRRMS